MLLPPLSQDGRIFETVCANWLSGSINSPTQQSCQNLVCCPLLISIILLLWYHSLRLNKDLQNWEPCLLLIWKKCFSSLGNSSSAKSNTSYCLLFPTCQSIWLVNTFICHHFDYFFLVMIYSSEGKLMEVAGFQQLGTKPCVQTVRFCRWMFSSPWEASVLVLSVIEIRWQWCPSISDLQLHHIICSHSLGRNCFCIITPCNACPRLAQWHLTILC